jgi:FkbM family methyltransferase
MPNANRLAAQAVLKPLLARLDQGDRSWLARHVVSERERRDVRALVDFSYGVIRGWKNSEFDIHLSGEVALLRRIRPLNPLTVIDVGANVGEWSLAALKTLPSATVHAFEVAPATAEKLVQNAAGCDRRLIINRCGLSDTEGNVTLFYTPDSDTASSLVEQSIPIAMANRQVTRVEELTVPVTTGDNYLRQHNISMVNLLKIDVEGAELAVMKGFKNSFEDGLIDLVQFEYGLVNLTTRIFLADIYNFLDRFGFVIGKLLPHGVGFKPYAVEDEDFIGLNFVACRQDRQELLAAIGCEPLSLDTSHNVLKSVVRPASR